MQILIHIGYPKTGSSAIQSHINCNKGWLAKRGVYVPTSGYCGGLGHCFLFGENDSDDPPKELSGLLNGPGTLEALRQEIDACDKAGFENVLLTWEGFCILDQSLIRRLKGCFDKYSVVLFGYVRAQPELTQSLILQAIKSGRFRKSIFAIQVDDALSSPWYLDFDKTFSKWADESDDSITIRTKIYEKSLLLNSDVVEDFIDWIGLKIDSAFVNQSKDLNHSLDYQSAALLALGVAAGLNPRNISRLSHALSKSSALSAGSHKNFLPRETIVKIREAHIDSNLRFLDKFFPENVDAEGATDFMSGQTPSSLESAVPIIGTYEELCNLLSSRDVEVWQGNILLGHHVSRVTNQPGNGWRDSENKGVWSIGECSEIIFRIPEVHPTEGPKGLLLTLTGNYFGDNTSTLVCIDGAITRVDLRSSALNIPIDEDKRENGIRVELRHDMPTSPLDQGSGASADKLAFCLQQIGYEFIWEKFYQ